MKATITYYIAIGVYLVCLVVIVVKMTFWPVCTSASTCDGWTIAGLAAAILGVTAAFLAILGAVFFAAWWTDLDKRVEKRVTEAFNTQIQSVKSTIDQLNRQTLALQNKADTLEMSIQRQEEQTREQVKQVQTSINELESQATLLKNTTENIAQGIRDLGVQTQMAQSTATLALQETQPSYLRTMDDHNKAKQRE